jgi:hypothetical protein
MVDSNAHAALATPIHIYVFTVSYIVVLRIYS